jgi:hypothetical protein
LSNNVSNILAADTRSTIAPTLPAPAAGPNATPRDCLPGARAYLGAGHTRKAQQSLQMAETRALDRSVRQGDISTSRNSRLLAQIRNARRALGVAIERT